MDDKDEKWLLEHLFYERWMLDCTIAAVLKLPEGSDWNAYYESFCVHARLLALFLTNNDTGNYGASDFVPNFRSRKPDNIIGLTNKIDPQVMHLAPKRPSGNDERKLNNEQCRELFKWLSSEFDRFVDQLPDDVRARWKDKYGKPEPLINVQDLRPQATNVTTSAQTNTSVSTFTLRDR